MKYIRLSLYDINSDDWIKLDKLYDDGYSEMDWNATQIIISNIESGIVSMRNLYERS